nr:retrovirus-related Pol polyprotein from transposon TNT 1-94 [Tanacetum cinerariifolium]
MTQDMEIDIKNTLIFTECVQNKVDKMLEIAAISYPKNEEFKKLVEIRNEKIMNAFKPRKVAAMLKFENVIESVNKEKDIANTPSPTYDLEPEAVNDEGLAQKDGPLIHGLMWSHAGRKRRYKNQTSIARTPEQNDVVEIRNRTLVEAARTILSTGKLPLFFWAEAIAIVRFTQNRSLVIPRHKKTPYHITNERKPTVKFFYIFASLCYIVRDGENLDKMKEKGDACNFVGYYTQSKGYRVYNKRTRFIVKTIHVNFDEFPQMMFEHNSSNLDPQCQTMAADHNNFGLAPQCQTMALEQNSLSPDPRIVSKSSAITTVDASDKRQPQKKTPSTSTAIAADLTQLDIQTPPEPTTQEQNENANENINQAENVMVDEGEFINIFDILHNTIGQKTIHWNKFLEILHNQLEQDDS